MIRFQFNQFKGTITQALIVLRSVEIDDFWTRHVSLRLSTLGDYPDSNGVCHLSGDDRGERWAPHPFFFQFAKKKAKDSRVGSTLPPKMSEWYFRPHLDSVCVPVGKICIIRIVFQSLKVIAKGFYMGEHLSSNWNRQSIYLLLVKYLQKCSLLCKHNFSVDPQIFAPINTCSELTFPFLLLF